MPQITYEQACEEAATARGLDPATDALRAAGMPFTVDQTGGFCMMVRVPFAEEAKRYFGITQNEDSPFAGIRGEVGEGDYVVYLYDDSEEWDCEGTLISQRTLAEDLASLLRRQISA